MDAPLRAANSDRDALMSFLDVELEAIDPLADTPAEPTREQLLATAAMVERVRAVEAFEIESYIPAPRQGGIIPRNNASLDLSERIERTDIQKKKDTETSNQIFECLEKADFQQTIELYKTLKTQTLIDENFKFIISALIRNKKWDLLKKFAELIPANARNVRFFQCAREIISGSAAIVNSFHSNEYKKTSETIDNYEIVILKGLLHTDNTGRLILTAQSLINACQARFNQVYNAPVCKAAIENALVLTCGIYTVMEGDNYRIALLNLLFANIFIFPSLPVFPFPIRALLFASNRNLDTIKDLRTQYDAQTRQMLREHEEMLNVIRSQTTHSIMRDLAGLHLAENNFKTMLTLRTLGKYNFSEELKQLALMMRDAKKFDVFIEILLSAPDIKPCFMDELSETILAQGAALAIKMNKRDLGNRIIALMPHKATQLSNLFN